MRKVIYIISFVCVSIVSLANSRTISIKGNTPTQVGNTEVLLSQDSIIVKPSTEATTIVVEVTDCEGEIISQQAVPACTNTVLNVNTPSLPTPCILRIRDDHGVVFEE